MTQLVQMINGIPTTIDVSLGGTSYQDSYVISAPISINDQITLPNSENYNGTNDELVVKHNGVAWTEGVEYQYQNSTTATYITVLIAIPSGGRIDFYKVV